jgi:hypothetical protein
MSKQPDALLAPSSIAAFMEALNGDTGELDAWLECNKEAEVRSHIKQATNAAIAERDALIEKLAGALRLIVQWDKEGLALLDHHINTADEAIAAYEQHTEAA